MHILGYVQDNFLTLLGLGGYVVVGVLAIAGTFSGQVNSRRRENDELTTSLIDNLDRKTKDQELELNLMREQTRDHAVVRDEQIKKLQDDLKVLEGKNLLLENLFKGRDPAMQSVFDQAPAIFAIARENNVMSKANNAAITELTNVITDLIATLKITVTDHEQS